MMRGDEMAQAAGAMSPEGTLAGSLCRAMIDSGPPGASALLRIGQSTPASGGVDRLAQLARLIEQDKTLAAIVRGGPSEQQIELSIRREKPPSSHLARQDEEFEHNREGEAGSALAHSGWYEVPTDDPPDPPPEYGEYDGPDYSNGLPDQRRGFKVFAALIGLALVGSASAFAYWALPDGPKRSDEVQVMAASVSPNKTPSPQEQSRSDEQPRDQSDERGVKATGGTMTGVEEPADAKPPILEARPPMSIALGPAPTKMAELTPTPTPPDSPAGTAQNQPPDVKKSAPRQTAPSATGQGDAHGVRYVVQLSSERGEAAAYARSRVLQTKYRDAFAGRSPFIRRADLGDRGVYYRVQMGPFAIEEAKQICGDLKKSGADCVVQRN